MLRWSPAPVDNTTVRGATNSVSINLQSYAEHLNHRVELVLTHFLSYIRKRHGVRGQLESLLT